MKRKQIFQATATALFLSLLAGGKALAFGFNFTPIALSDPTSPFRSYSSVGQGLGTAGGWSNYNLSFKSEQKGFAINNNGGTVAYYADLIGGGKGIFTSTGVRTPTLIVDTQGSSKFSSFGQGLSINKTGTVAFFATLKTGATGIYTSNGIGEPKLIASTTEGYSFNPGLSINDKGEVAFSAMKSGVQQIFKYDTSQVINISNCMAAGNTASQCPLTGQGVYNYLNAQAPSINNDGIVAFVSMNGLFTSNGGPSNPILPSSTYFSFGSYREANINDNGLVSAYAHLNNGAAGQTSGVGQVLISSDGSPTGGSIVAGNNVTLGQTGFYYVGTTSINDKGKIAFMANQVTGKNGIFIGADAVKDKIIGVGDTLLGSTVQELFFDRNGLSNDNEISFWAKLANGVSGIFRANSFADSQYNPWMPNCSGGNGATHGFCDVGGNGWFDPPTAYGFNYKMTSDSLFTSILDLPSNFIKPFTVAVGDIILGKNFTAGDRIDFSQFAAELGALLVNGTGVKEFTVTGLDVDPNNPAVFPIKLASNTDLMSFDMHALLNPDAAPKNPGVPGGPDPDPGIGGGTEPVPEPTTILGTLVFGAVAAKLKRQRASANKEV